MNNNAFLDQLSKQDLIELMCLSQRSLRCFTENQFKSLTSDLGKLFPFENAASGFANINEFVRTDAADPKINICNSSYPVEYVELYFKNQYHLSDAIIDELLMNS